MILHQFFKAHVKNFWRLHHSKKLDSISFPHIKVKPSFEFHLHC